MIQPATRVGSALPGKPWECTENTHLTVTPPRGVKEWGYLYTDSHPSWVAGLPKRCSFPGTSGLPHSGKVGTGAQRLPSGRARQALAMRSLRGMSGQGEGIRTGHPKHLVHHLRGLLGGEMRSCMKSG